MSKIRRKLDSTRVLVDGKVAFVSLDVDFGHKVFDSCIGNGSSMTAPFHKRPQGSVVELQQAYVTKFGEIDYMMLCTGKV